MGRGRGQGGRGGKDDSRRRAGGMSSISDQYGGFEADRDPTGGGPGRGGTGGGTAGGSSSAQVSYTRQVPKFLQAHAHLLGKGHARQEEEPTLTAEEVKQDAGTDSEDEQAALQRALEENPELAGTDQRLQKLADKTAAAQSKELGNEAFKSGRHEAAVQHFDECIRLDPTNEVFFSNRAAARIALKQHAHAVQDAIAATKLKPGWAKGWARLGAAYTGLEEHAEARKAYQQALKREPDDQSLQQACHLAHIAEAKMGQQAKHTFNVVSSGAPSKKPKLAQVRQQKTLSFGDEEDEGQH